MKTGRELRDEALAYIECARSKWLGTARFEAIKIAVNKGQVTINDLREVISLPEDFSPNTWGAVFKSKDFEAVGYTQASHAAAHARVVRIYKLKQIGSA
jgi:hypothetical protein